MCQTLQQQSWSVWSKNITERILLQTLSGLRMSTDDDWTHCPTKENISEINSCIFLFPNRAEESEEMSYMKELTSVSEPTQIQLGLLWVKIQSRFSVSRGVSFLLDLYSLYLTLNRWESSSQSLRLHLLQLKSLNRSHVRDGYKVWVSVMLWFMRSESLG